MLAVRIVAFFLGAFAVQRHVQESSFDALFHCIHSACRHGSKMNALAFVRAFLNAHRAASPELHSNQPVWLKTTAQFELPLDSARVRTPAQILEVSAQALSLSEVLGRVSVRPRTINSL